MQCPKCRKTKNKVIDSRPTKDKSSIWHRRECLACSTRFQPLKQPSNLYYRC